VGDLLIISSDNQSTSWLKPLTQKEKKTKSNMLIICPCNINSSHTETFQYISGSY